MENQPNYQQNSFAWGWQQGPQYQQQQYGPPWAFQGPGYGPSMMGQAPTSDQSETPPEGVDGTEAPQHNEEFQNQQRFSNYGQGQYQGYQGNQNTSGTPWNQAWGFQPQWMPMWMQGNWNYISPWYQQNYMQPWQFGQYGQYYPWQFGRYGQYYPPQYGQHGQYYPLQYGQQNQYYPPQYGQHGHYYPSQYGQYGQYYPSQFAHQNQCFPGQFGQQGQCGNPYQYLNYGTGQHFGYGPRQFGWQRPFNTNWTWSNPHYNHYAPWRYSWPYSQFFGQMYGRPYSQFTGHCPAGVYPYGSYGMNSMFPWGWSGTQRPWGEYGYMSGVEFPTAA